MLPGGGRRAEDDSRQVVRTEQLVYLRPFLERRSGADTTDGRRRRRRWRTASRPRVVEEAANEVTAARPRVVEEAADEVIESLPAAVDSASFLRRLLACNPLAGGGGRTGQEAVGASDGLVSCAASDRGWHGFVPSHSRGVLVDGHPS